MYVVGLAFLLCGLIALYRHQSEAAGVFGLVAFGLAFTGTAVTLGVFRDNAFLVPSLAAKAPGFLDAEEVSGPADSGFLLSIILCFGGLTLFGLSALRAGVYPRLASVLFIAGALVAFAPFPAATLILDAAVIWFGLSLLLHLENNKGAPSGGSFSVPNTGGRTEDRASANVPEPARPS